MKKQLKTDEKQVYTHEGEVNTHEPVHLENSISKLELSEVNRGYEKRCTPQYGVVPWEWDSLDTEIIKLIQADFHLRGIARQTGKQPSAILKRLRRMEKFGMISSHPQNLAGFRCIIYTVKGKCSPFLTHNEGEVNTHEEIRYKMHGLSFKAPILAGARPKGKKQYKTKSWTGEIFTGQDFTIRVTPKSVIIDLHNDLGTDTDANLLTRYHTIARDHLLTFSERYMLKLGEVTLLREPHRLLPGTSKLANLLLGGLGGEIYHQETGLQIDKSREEGEIEFIGEKGAATLKKTLQFPEVALIVSAINESSRKSNREIINELRLMKGQEHKQQQSPGMNDRVETPESIKLQERDLLTKIYPEFVGRRKLRHEQEQKREWVTGYE